MSDEKKELLSTAPASHYSHHGEERRGEVVTVIACINRLLASNEDMVQSLIRALHRSFVEGPVELLL
jgi:hypothetical protein